MNEWMGWLRQQAGLKPTGFHPTRPGASRRPTTSASIAHWLRLNRQIGRWRGCEHASSFDQRNVLAQDDQADPGDRPGRQEQRRPRRGSTHARVSRSVAVLGPRSRKPSATTSGTRPNKIMSPSLNSCSRAGMTNNPSTIQ